MRDGTIIAAGGLLGLVWCLWMRQEGRFGWPLSPMSRRGFCWSFPLFFAGLLVMGPALALKDHPLHDGTYRAGLWMSGVGLVLLLLAFTSALGWPHPRWMMPAWLREQEDRTR